MGGLERQFYRQRDVLKTYIQKTRRTVRMRCMNLDKGLGGFFCFVLFFWPCTFKKKKRKCSEERREPGGREPWEATAGMSRIGGPGAWLSAV